MATSFFTRTGRLFFTSSGLGVSDVSLPTFAGITSATPATDGSVELAWALATSTKPPVEYDLYVALGSVSAAALFIDANITEVVPAGKTSGKVFLLPDQTTYLVKGLQYTVGVRARDVFGYKDGNTAIQVATAIASGNLPAVLQTLFDQIAATEVLLASDHVNLNQDHVNLAADITTLGTQLTTLSGYLTTMNTYLGTFNTQNSDQAVNNSDQATNNATQAAQLTTMAGYLSMLGTDLTILGSEISDLHTENTGYAALNVTLAGQLTTLGADLTQLASSLTDLANEVTALDAISSSIENSATIIDNSANKLKSIGATCSVSLSVSKAPTIKMAITKAQEINC